MEGERKEVEYEYRPQVDKEGGERGALESSSSSSLRDVEMTIREIDDSQLVGAPVTVAEEHVVGRLGAGGGDVCMVDVEVRSCEVGVAKMLTSAAGDVTGKRKRGRPLRGRPRVAPPSSQQRQKQDEEDVCFICFDGGSLVLCDRRGCPKAYHPACIKRDEAFFRSKAKWNCGWHICSTCQKASHYMCYTCTYSLCKGCTKNADYLCVRGNKGFCGTCMRTVRLIENIAVGYNEMVQVDFDDKTSWEYLFKVYWICLKNKLLLTLDELIKAKNPWKADELPKARNLWHGTNVMAPKGVPISELHHCNDEKGSKVNNQPVLVDNGNSVVMVTSALDKTAYSPFEGTAWATKELMEFIAHMKNGDVSVLSQFDVQALLLEYIKRNNLRDPRQKSQIVCDSRLISLFGKARVGHFEMLKLLEYHFLIKEKPSVEETVRVGVGDAVRSRVEAAENNGTQVIVNNDRRRKPRRKTDEGGTMINANPDECAAIDVHNINLLYLKRSLVENLLDDVDKFPEKVVGSFVRIKISGGDQKIEAYRLVQVVGTTKVAEAYTVGTKMTDFMLEILNLDKKEIVSIDGISNQEFSEDECRRLRQSIKCGLNKRLTVGEILGKATMLWAVKVDDGLEAEILRLNHLRDRASEKGQRKQLRECVEKLELLKSPDELQRRLLEIPKIHADPKLDPSYEADEYPREAVGKKPGGHGRPRNSGCGRKEVQAHSMLSSNILSDTGNRGHSSNSQKTKVGVSAQITSERNSQSVVQSETSSGIASAILPLMAPTRVEIFGNDIESDRLWHYQDPTGKVQGPFAMRILRKWSSNGLFPLGLRVWKINEKQDDSVLLTDALVGRFHKEPALPQEVFSASTNNDKGWENGLYMDQSTDTTWADSKNVESSSKSAQSYANFHDNSNSELMSTIFGSDSPSWTTSVTVTPLENGQVQSSVHGLDASKSSKSWTDQPQKCSNSSSPPSSGKFCETPSPQVRKDHGDEKLSTDLGDVKDDLIRIAEGQSNLVANEEKRAESEVYSSPSPGQNWGPLALNSSSSSGWASNSGIVSESMSVEKLKQHKEIDFSDLPRPTPKFSKEGVKVQPAESTPPASSSVPTLDSGPTWSTASSLVVGGAQLPEVAGEWYGYSSAPTKPSVDEWDSNVVPASSLKPTTEVASDHVATPTSGSVQLTQCSETHLTIDADAWQPIVTEGPENEFSLVDESVSDLLAEVEAMESLGGLPSPTSRMTCGELTQGSENDCFTPVAEFSPVPDQGKNDALSSTGDMQMPSHLVVAHEQPLQLSHMPSRPAVSEALVVPQMPSHLHLANEPLQVSHLPSQTTSADELGTSHMHRQSNVTNGPVELPQIDAFDPHKSFSAPSSNGAVVDGDTKPVDGSGSQWVSGSEVQPLESSHFPHEKTGLDSHQSAESHTDAYSGSTKVNANLNRGPAAKGTTNMIWGGPGYGTVQHQASLNTTTNSTENPGSWGSHNPRHGGERSSGARDHRQYYQGRESGFGRDSRSTWNRQPLLGVGNGGHPFRPPPKGQRLCKYYESGYCRKGASCSYWHPGP